MALLLERRWPGLQTACGAAAVVSVLLHRSGFLKKGSTFSIVGCYTELVNASMSACSDGD